MHQKSVHSRPWAEFGLGLRIVLCCVVCAVSSRLVLVFCLVSSLDDLVLSIDDARFNRIRVKKRILLNSSIWSYVVVLSRLA